MNKAGMIAKYFATSLAMEKVVTRRFSIWDAILCASALRRRTAHLLSNGTREMYQGYRSATLKIVMEEVEYR